MYFGECVADSCVRSAAIDYRQSVQETLDDVYHRDAFASGRVDCVSGNGLFGHVIQPLAKSMSNV